MSTTLFNKTTTDNVILEVTNSQSGYGLNVTNIFNSPNLWSVIFKENTFSSGNIDIAVVDLTNGNTISCINTIGNNVIEYLVVFNNRANAIAAGRPINSVFLNRNSPGTPEGSEINGFPITGKWYRDIVLPA